MSQHNPHLEGSINDFLQEATRLRKERIAAIKLPPELQPVALVQAVEHAEQRAEVAQAEIDDYANRTFDLLRPRIIRLVHDVLDERIDSNRPASPTDARTPGE